MPALAPHRARPDVRHSFRDLLTAQKGYGELDLATRRDLASGLVRIGSVALNNDEVGQRPRLSYAQNAGSEYSGTAIDRMAGTTRSVLNAVSFPRFVNELITGVFKAMNDSNQQQLTAFVDLIRNVAQTTEGFGDSNIGVSGARQWLADHFPTAYQVSGGGNPADDAEELAGLAPEERRQRQQELQAEHDAETRLELRPGATPPTEAALRTALGMGPNDAVTPSNPEGMLPLAQQVLARNRQQLLATMIQMGLQRIVIESGRLNAAMNFHIDASSVAASDRGSQFDSRTTAGASASFGGLGWGGSASLQSTIGYVSTERNQSTESSHADLNLSSGVELVFRTDYVPLTRLAGVADVERIRVNTINPDAEAQRIAADRTAARSAEQTEMATRSSNLNTALHSPPPLTATPPPVPTPQGGGAGSGGPSGGTTSGTSGGKTGGTTGGTTGSAAPGTTGGGGTTGGTTGGSAGGTTGGAASGGAGSGGTTGGTTGGGAGLGTAARP